MEGMRKMCIKAQPPVPPEGGKLAKHSPRFSELLIITGVFENDE